VKRIKQNIEQNVRDFMQSSGASKEKRRTPNTGSKGEGLHEV
jgi:hypothetical protein